MQKANFISGVILSAFSLWMLVYAIPVHTGEGFDYGLSPAGLPKVMAVAILVLALIQTFTHIPLKSKRPKEKDPDGFDSSHGTFLLKIGVLFTLTLVSMNLAGFLTASIFFMLVFQYLCGQRNYLLLIPLAVFVPLTLKYAFWYGMGILLPTGSLF